MSISGLLSDANCEGEFDELIRLMQSDYRKYYWDSLALKAVWLADVGLDHSSSDRTVWDLCQHQRLVLLTANRNKRGADSLESVIADSNTSDSLPVMTIGSVRRLKRESGYAERVADQLLVYLVELDDFLGAGRLYLP